MRKLWFVVFLAVFSTSVLAQTDTASKSVPGKKDAVLSDYGKLPLSFERNEGQVDDHVKFVFHGRGLSLFLTNDEAVIAVRKSGPTTARAKRPGGNPLSAPKRNESRTVASVGMKLLGANPALRPEGAEELPGKANYFIGNDPSRWRTNVPTYAKAKYKDVYPGVDLVYYGHEGRLEYDFVLAPGADPQQIRLKVRNTGRLKVDEKGDLRLGSASSELRLEKPLIYQTAANGERRAVEGGYVVKGRQVRFEVARYDKTESLVIDPTLVYSTYLGGSGQDQGVSIAVDASGNAYVTGLTAFPPGIQVTPGAWETVPSWPETAFVLKLNASGSAVVYSTYLGGNGLGWDQGLGVTVDGEGNAYVTGVVAGSDFPTTDGAFRTSSPGGFEKIFVTKVNAAGSALIYSTYLGNGTPNGIVVDAVGNVYMAGNTSSTAETGFPDFPTTPGAFQTAPRGPARGVMNGFVTKFNAAGSALIYSTYLGSNDTDVTGIAVDAAGNAYVCGTTNPEPGFPGFPTTPGAFETMNKPPTVRAFVTKFNPEGSALVYSTLLGGSGYQQAHSIAINKEGNAYVTGFTTSPDFPTTPAVFQTVCESCNVGGYEAFITELNPVGSGLVYSTFLGGSGTTNGKSIAIDAEGNTYIFGDTSSFDFPTTADAVQTNYGGGATDAFFTKLKANGSAPLYSTYLGGNDIDSGNAVVVDRFGAAYMTGYSFSSNFPVASSSLQTTFGGVEDGFITKIELGFGPPTDKNQCKNDGWEIFTIPRKFKNQGDCVSYMETGK